MSFTITIPGVPVAKERPKVYQGRGSTPAKTKAAEQAIQWELKAKRIKPVDYDVCVTVAFYLPDHRPIDLDNLQKLVFDACNKFAWKDDSQVVESHAYLFRGVAFPHTLLKVGPAPAPEEMVDIDPRGTDGFG